MPRAVLIACLLFTALPASAQVRQCIAADGSRLYTDRTCADLNATHAPPAPPSSGARLASRQTGCARTLQDLILALEQALQSGDVNRLAGLYDWAGLGGAAANATLDRLQRIAARSVLAIQAESDATSGTITGLRIDQVDTDTAHPRNVHVGVRRRLGCLWLTP